MRGIDITPPPVGETDILDWPIAAQAGPVGKPAVVGARIGNKFLDFQPISLDETNRRAQMLSRVDNKYVVDFEHFNDFLKKIKKKYVVLEIDGRRQFSYDSCYYDDAFGCYYDHHQGRRRRFKVRTREYLDTGGKYFEIKLKGLRGKTEKHRIASEFLVTPQIEGQYLEVLNRVYRKNYRTDMPYALTPSLMVGYKRCTLVALDGGERVTVDYSIHFSAPENRDSAIRIGDDFIIIETKSADGKGFADSALKKLKIRKASKCSKYCIGVNLTGSVSKNNFFRHTLKHVRKNIVSSSEALIALGQASTGQLAEHGRSTR